ncbi:MAG: cysteine--tRNA ligase [Candidatus Aenigmatarchaeota archaeon]|nr:MAG: cysteine--tRNA ligase [Candidatus Aenigmarchaeota archaeon]RLJ08757.1 MAG: cysteine--tRNA ligase [Candidatus Aenigmarchaeota archaeon]RLJ09047.1 MAG: cysteine--tRNA ligase [Candidatus Aenigmarchaeota archaeon]
MVLRFYNTMTRKKEVFKPLEKGTVKMYNCGPTVYNFAHIGNFRAYMLADLLRRYLEYKGYKVMQVMNITDVGHMSIDEVADSTGEDKIEKKAKEEKKTPWEIAEFYTKAFLEDSRSLNLKEPMVRPKATEHIKEMIELIEKLIEKGYAYEVNGSVYFDVFKFKDYGKLSGNTLEKLKAGAGGRVEENPEKKHPLDFALWIHNPRHIMQWDSPWGKGHPGWHIECSAMSMKYLGETLDIHTGGEDNIFPHHECEIAQSEGATGKTFVRYWLHTRHLVVEGKKMSKRLGNFYTLRDLVAKGHNPKAIRFLLLSAHYRTKMNFTEEALKGAEKTVKSMMEFMESLKNVKEGRENPEIKKLVEKTKKEFEDALDDDLNISPALSAIFNLMKEVNKKIDSKEIGKEDAELVMRAMERFDMVLGLDLGKEKLWFSLDEAETEVKEKLLKREELRKEKKWEEADKIRNELKEMGIVVEDTPEGPRWRKL